MAFPNSFAHALKVESLPESAGLEQLQQELPAPRAGMEGKPLNTLRLPEAMRAWNLAFNPGNSDELISGDGLGHIYLWDVSTGKRIREFEQAEPLARISALAIDPQGRRVAAANERKVLALWDFETGRRLPISRSKQGTIHSVAFHPSGQLLLAACADGVLRFWGTEKGDEQGSFRVSPSAQTKEFLGLAYRPQGGWIATLNVEGGVDLWNPGKKGGPEGKRVGKAQQMQLRAQRFNPVFSPQGDFLVTGSGEEDLASDLHLWRVTPRGLQEAWREELSDSLSGIAFSPDGKWIAAAIGEEGTVRFLSMNQQYHSFAFSHDAKIRALAFSPDGRKLATSGDNGTIKIWDVSTLSAGSEERAALRAKSDSIKQGVTLNQGDTLRLSIYKDSGDQVVESVELRFEYRNPKQPMASFEVSCPVQQVLIVGRNLAESQIHEDEGHLGNWDSWIQQLRKLAADSERRFRQRELKNKQVTIQVGFPSRKQRYTHHNQVAFCSFRTMQRMLRPPGEEDEEGWPQLEGSWGGLDDLFDTVPLLIEVTNLDRNRQRVTLRVDDFYQDEDNQTQSIYVASVHRSAASGLKSPPAAGTEGKGEVFTWSLPKSRFENLQSYPDRILFSLDGKKIVRVTNGLLQLLFQDAASGKAALPDDLEKGAVMDIALDSEGRLVVATEEHFYFWDITTGKRTGRVNLQSSDPRPMFHDAIWEGVLSPDGSKLVAWNSQSLNLGVRLWDVKTGERISVLGASPPKGPSLRCAVFSPDGRLLAVNASDGSVTVWDLETLKVKATAGPFDQPIRELLFDPAGGRLLLISSNFLHSWKMGDAAAERIVSNGMPKGLKWHQGGKARFSPDGRLLAIATGHGEIHLLETAGWETLATLAAGVDIWNNDLSFSSDGATLATSHGYGVLLQWNLSSILKWAGGDEAQRAQWKEERLRMLRESPSFAERVTAAEELHERNLLVPEELQSDFAALPSAGAQQAALMECYLYRRGRISLEALQERVSDYLRWEQEAIQEEEEGRRHRSADETHTSVATTSLNGLTIQRLFNLAMRVPRNRDQGRGLLVKTIFESGGLEIQGLPAHSDEVGSRIWELWNELEESENFTLIFVLPDAWVHRNTDYFPERPGDEALLWRWVASRAEFSKEIEMDLGFPRTSPTGYLEWLVRGRRSSAFGGFRREFLGRVPVRSPAGEVQPLDGNQLRGHRRTWFREMNALIRALRRMPNDPEPFVRETADLPPRQVTRTAVLVSTKSKEATEKIIRAEQVVREEELYRFYEGRRADFPGPGEGAEPLGRLKTELERRRIALAWEPAVEQDPALFGEVARLLADSSGVDSLLRENRYGWGLELRRNGNQATLVVPPAGPEPFVAYRDFVQRHLRPKVETRKTPAILLREDGVYTLHPDTGLWVLVDQLWMPDGLGAFFQDRRHLGLALMLPAPDAPDRGKWWADLERRLDPRDLRREIPCEVGTGRPAWGYIGKTIRHPRTDKQVPISFIVPAAAGTEEEVLLAELKKKEGKEVWVQLWKPVKNVGARVLYKGEGGGVVEGLIPQSAVFEHSDVRDNAMIYGWLLARIGMELEAQVLEVPAFGAGKRPTFALNTPADDLDRGLPRTVDALLRLQVEQAEEWVDVAAVDPQRKKVWLRAQPDRGAPLVGSVSAKNDLIYTWLEVCRWEGRKLPVRVSDIVGVWPSAFPSPTFELEDGLMDKINSEVRPAMAGLSPGQLIQVHLTRAWHGGAAGFCRGERGGWFPVVLPVTSIQAGDLYDRVVSMDRRLGWVWNRIESGEPVPLWVKEVQDRGPMPQVIAEARLSAETLQQEMPDAGRRMEQLIGTTVFARLIREGKQGGELLVHSSGGSWTTLFLPLSRVPDRRAGRRSFDPREERLRSLLGRWIPVIPERVQWEKGLPRITVGWGGQAGPSAREPAAGMEEGVERALQRLARETQPWKRAAAIYGLGERKAKARAAVPVLLGLIDGENQDKSRQVRQHALQALHRIGLDNPEDLDRILQVAVADDESPQTQQWARTSLRMLARHDKRMGRRLEALSQAEGGGSGASLAKAIVAWLPASYWGTEGASPKEKRLQPVVVSVEELDVLQGRLDNPNLKVRVRLKAIRTLGKMGVADEPALGQLREAAAAEGSALIQRAARAAIRKIEEALARQNVVSKNGPAAGTEEEVLQELEEKLQTDPWVDVTRGRIIRDPELGDVERVLVEYDGGKMGSIGGYIAANRLFYDPNRILSKKALAVWLDGQSSTWGESWPVRIEDIRWAPNPHVRFARVEPVTLNLFDDERIFRAQMRGIRPNRVEGFLRWMLKGGVDPAERIAQSFSDWEDWKKVPRGVRGNTYDWLKREGISGRGGPEMFKFLETAVQHEEGWYGLRVWAIKEMAQLALLDPPDPERLEATRKAIRQVWLSVGNESEPIIRNVTRRELRKIARGVLKQSQVLEWLDLEPDPQLGTNQEALWAELREEEPWQWIREYLDWLMSRDVDPRPFLVALYRDPQWEQLKPGRRIELLFWLANHADGPTHSLLFKLFKDAASPSGWGGREPEGRRTRARALYGLAASAVTAEEITQAEQMIQDLRKESKSWKDGGGRQNSVADILRSAQEKLDEKQGVSSAGMEEVLQELREKEPGEWVTVRVLKAVEQVGVFVLYKGENGGSVEGLIPLGLVFKDRNVRDPAVIYRWLLARTGTELQVQVREAPEFGTGRRPTFALNASAAELEKGLKLTIEALRRAQADPEGDVRAVVIAVDPRHHRAWLRFQTADGEPMAGFVSLPTENNLIYAWLEVCRREGRKLPIRVTQILGERPDAFPDLIFELKDSLEKVIDEEVRPAMTGLLPGQPIEVVVTRAWHDGGAGFYRGESGGWVPVFLPMSLIPESGDSRDKVVSFDRRLGWLCNRIESGEPVQVWINRVDALGPMPGLTAKARLSKTTLQSEMKEATDRTERLIGKTFPARLINVSDREGGIFLIRFGERSWTTLSLPMSKVPPLSKSFAERMRKLKGLLGRTILITPIRVIWKRALPVIEADWGELPAPRVTSAGMEQENGLNAALDELEDLGWVQVVVSDIRTDGADTGVDLLYTASNGCQVTGAVRLNRLFADRGKPMPLGAKIGRLLAHGREPLKARVLEVYRDGSSYRVVFALDLSLKALSQEYERVLTEVEALINTGGVLPVASVDRVRPATGMVVHCEFPDGRKVSGIVWPERLKGIGGMRVSRDAVIDYFRMCKEHPETIGSLKAVPVQVTRGREGLSVVFKLQGAPVGLRILEDPELFLNEILRIYAPNYWGFLTRMLETGHDPREQLLSIFYKPSAWEKIPEPGRVEILRWLAEHVVGSKNKKWAERLYDLFKMELDSPSTEEKTPRIQAAYGLAETAQVLGRDAEAAPLLLGFLEEGLTWSDERARVLRRDAWDLLEPHAKRLLESEALAELTQGYEESTAAGTEEVFQELERIRWEEDGRIDVRVKRLVPDRGGARIRFEVLGAPLSGFLPMSDVFDDPDNKVSVESKEAWLEFHRRNEALLPAKIRQIRKRNPPNMPDVIVALNEPLSRVNDWMAKTWANLEKQGRGTPISMQVLETGDSSGPHVIYFSETAAVGGYLPLENVQFGMREAVAPSIVRVWLRRHASGRTIPRFLIEDFKKDKPVPSVIVRLERPLRDLHADLEPAVAKLKKLGVNDVAWGSIMQVNENGAEVLYQVDPKGWIVGFIPMRCVSNDRRVDNAQRMRWLTEQQKGGNPIPVRLVEMNPSRADFRVIFRLVNPLRPQDIQALSLAGTEENERGVENRVTNWLKQLDSPRLREQLHAVRGLGRIGPAAEVAISRLRQIVNDDAAIYHPQVRAAAGLALAEILEVPAPKPREIQKLFRQAVDRELSAKVRSRALRRIGMFAGIGTRPPEIIPPILEILAGPDIVKVRGEAMVALKRLGCPADLLVPELLKIAADSEEGLFLRRRAQAVLYRVAREHPRVSMPLIREAAASATNGEMAAVGNYLLGRLERAGVNEADKEEVVTDNNELAALTVPELEKILAIDEKGEQRAAAARELGRRGPEARAAARSLREASTDDWSSGVRTAAAEALKKIQASAGSEEVRRIGLAEFERPGKFPLTDSHLEQIDAAKRKGALTAVITPIPDSLPLYVQGEGLFQVIQSQLRQPSAVRLEPRKIAGLMQWQDPGLVLEDGMLDKSAPNPLGLLVRRIWAVDVPELNPVELLAQIFRDRLGIPESDHVGQLIFTKGKVNYLVILSKAA